MVIRTHDNLILNCVLHRYAVTAGPGEKQSKRAQYGDKYFESMTLF